MNPQISQMNADKRDPETYAIIGAAMAVHNELGHGFLEAVYQEALAIEFERLKIPFVKETKIEVNYRGKILSASYRTDFICFNTILVELKALQKLTGIEEAQVINYLKATGLSKALLINFGESQLKYKRLVFNLRESV